ncbi:MAG: hypothetical protein ACHQ53_07010 [Polyangiales bacterium]
MHRARSARSGIPAAFMVGACLLALSSCSKKKSSSDTVMDAGEPCLQIGVAQTGCSCSPSQPLGIRQCGMGFVWGPCMCRASQTAIKCTQGQEVMCSPCAGEAQGRTTTCLTDGTFDCGCQSTSPGTGGTSSGGTGGSGGQGQGGSGGTPADKDAGGDHDGG